MARTILLVEDNADSREIYRTLLEHCRYTVIEARTGNEGIRLAREKSPDLILMDFAMPGMNGWDATRILKAQDETERIPIIALTAHAFEMDEEKARAVGCAGYLAKPVAPRRVLEEVERILARDSRDPVR